jgi:acetyl esterase/lipase
MTTAQSVESVVYSTPGGAELTLDIFRPASGNRGVAVLVFHGGAWRLGSPKDVHERTAALAAQGFVGIAVQYRFLDVAPWPAPLEDAAAALSWVRDNAGQLGIDPGKVVVQGHSAGAHISLMACTLEAALRPAAVVAYYPPIGFHSVPEPPGGILGASVELLTSQQDELGRLPSWMLLPPDPSQADLDAVSPIELVTPEFPPVIIFQGTADKALPLRASINLHRRLVDLGVPSELHTYAGRDHEFDMAPSAQQATVAAATSFLDRLVGHPELNAEEIRRYVFPPAPEA